MFRFLIAAVLGVAAAGGAAYYFELWTPPGIETTAAASTPDANQDKPVIDVGQSLYPPASEPVREEPQQKLLGPDPVVFPDFVINPINKQDVSCQRDGQLLFVGQEIFQSDPNAPVPTFSASVFVGDREVVKTYRKLERGDVVKPGDMVAMLDPTLALCDVSSKKAKIEAARADYEAAKATHSEMRARYDRIVQLKILGQKLVNPEDEAAAKLGWLRAGADEQSKREAVNVAIIDLDSTVSILHQHEIRNKMSGAGLIKAVYKYRGDSVKNGEPVLQLQDIEYLRAEGMVDAQYLDRLQVGMKVTLEPTVQEMPWRVLRGHRGEITGVAVSNNVKEPQIVSASMDRKIAVWGLSGSATQRVFAHAGPVRSLACSPVHPDCKHNWCLSGCTDGSVRLWDLDGKDNQPLWEKVVVGRDGLPVTVTTLAFSPDGRWFAAGAEDGTINLFVAATGERLFGFDAAHGVEQCHEGAVTALHFTEQARLISAGRDNTLRVWELHEKGAKPIGPAITDRSGGVAQLGVSHDGSRMLLERGKLLQVLSIPDARPLSHLHSLSGGTSFEGVALYSPDSSLILTGGLAEGRLQLWRAPRADSRGFELRQFTPPERSTVTCAAFGHGAGLTPGASFAVSGNKDGSVYVWPVPTKDPKTTWDDHRVKGLQLNLVERSLDASTRQGRIGVDVHNPVDGRNSYRRLMPGRAVTVVIEP